MHEIISREQAASQGLKRYFTGEPCNKRGHISQRFVANAGCIACMQFRTPNKRQGPSGTNVGWPAVGLVFSAQGATPDEMEAAFRYIEAMRWHDYAVLEMRKNPALLEQYRTKMTAEEVGMLEAKLERARSTPKMQEALITPVCGYGQHYYGPPIAVGDLVMCKRCRIEERIVAIS